jgi:hypothetical protein
MLGQNKNSKIDYIAFKLAHSMRITNHIVEIEIKNSKNGASVRVISIPMKGYKEYEHAKIDKFYKIESKIFLDLIKDVNDLSKIDLKKALGDGIGVDGTGCKIEFGTKLKTKDYGFWSPDYKTEKRGLTGFLNLCKKIIKIGKMKPDDVL